MHDWRELTLGDVLEVKYGKDHKHLEDGDIPLFGSGGIMRRVNKSLCTDESILIPRKGTLNNVIYCNEPFWTVDTMFYTILNRSLIIPKFVFYQLTLIDFNNLNVGSAVPSLTVPVIKEITLTLPPLPEQQAIAEVLSSLDDKIDLLHRNNKTLEEMAETLFRQWFVEGAKEDWEVKRLDDICSHIKKSVNPKKEGSTLFLHYSLPAYDNGKRPELTEASAILSNKYLIQQDDMLISKLNPRTPRVWMIGNTALNSICSTEFQVYRAKEDCYRAFSYCFLKTQQVTDTLAGAASGTSGSHQRVNPEDISALEFTLPPIELLQRFQSVVKPAFDKIQLNNQTILNLETTRNSLLPKLMSGQVRVMSSI
jgi:type I restriction enzyme S subunit